MNHLIIDRITEVMLRERRAALQKEALELASYIKQNQDINHSLVNMCQRYEDLYMMIDVCPSIVIINHLSFVDFFVKGYQLLCTIHHVSVMLLWQGVRNCVTKSF